MKMQWQKVWIKTTVWLTAEILLNLLGIDDLADYGEFIFGRHFIATSDLTELAIATPPSCSWPNYASVFQTNDGEKVWL